MIKYKATTSKKKYPDRPQGEESLRTGFTHRKHRKSMKGTQDAPVTRSE